MDRGSTGRDGVGRGGAGLGGAAAECVPVGGGAAGTGAGADAFGGAAARGEAGAAAGAAVGEGGGAAGLAGATGCAGGCGVSFPVISPRQVSESGRSCAPDDAAEGEISSTGSGGATRMGVAGGVAGL